MTKHTKWFDDHQTGEKNVRILKFIALVICALVVHKRAWSGS